MPRRCERKGRGTNREKNGFDLDMTQIKVRGFGFAFLLVSAHAVVGILHAWAHFELRVAMSLSQSLFVVGIVGGAPCLSLPLLRFRSVQLGWMTFLFSMLASLVFGLYFHFVKAGPDKVNMLRQSPVFFVHVFQVTAIILALIELFGTAAGFVFFRRGRSVRSTT
jgi:hypothetical protein